MTRFTFYLKKKKKKKTGRHNKKQEELFKRMLKFGMDPDEGVYITMIDGYSKNGRAIEARQ
jgi:hypothetical protein